jgi:hypothetical protein
VEPLEMNRLVPAVMSLETTGVKPTPVLPLPDWNRLP